MKKFWVYIHTCPNGKKYVGITTYPKPEYRWQEGKGYEHQLFGKAILKYGWDNITHEVFEVDSAEEMYRKEVELISFYHSNDPNFGYNLSSGGEKSTLGSIRSEESRKRIAEANRRKAKDPEVRRKQSEAKKGKPRSEEIKKKMSEAQKKVHSDPEYRKRISEAMKGKPVSKETRKKLSEAHRGKTMSEEARKHMSEAHKGKPKPFSEEHKKHIAEAAKKRANDPENRRKMSEARKGKPQPKVKISLPDGTILEITKQALTRWYVNKGKEFEYVS